MAKDARNKIIEAAVKLYNERGFENVSFRQVATEAGVAVGTLTYHFAKQEDLLQEILSSVHKGFKGQLNKTLRGRDLLAHLVDLICIGEQNTWKYPFYFRNIAAAMECSSTLAAEVRHFEAALFDYYSWSLTALQEDGFVRDDLDGQTIKTVAYSLVTLQSSWNLISSPFANETIEPVGEGRALCTLILTIINPSHLQEYQEMCDTALP